jgi:hypothetical protein
MGQAKQRGTKEERSVLAKEKIKELLSSGIDPLTFLSPEKVIEYCLDELTKLDVNFNQAVVAPYESLLRYMWSNLYQGACHSTSAVLFILFSELNLTPKLCIGEVKRGDNFFDHSWVEMDGQIFDVAVSLPQLEGRQVGGPVFASVDLYTSIRTNLLFGISDGTGLDETAQIPVNRTLFEYSVMQRPQLGFGEKDIWALSSQLAADIGLDRPSKDLQERYGHVRREFRGR